MKLRVGQRVGVRKEALGNHAFGIVASIKKRPRTTPLVMLWSMQVAPYGNGWPGYVHLDASHLVPFRQTERALLKEARASILAARRMVAP